MGKKLLFAAIAAGLFIMSGCQNNIGLSLDGKLLIKHITVFYLVPIVLVSTRLFLSIKMALM